MSFCIHIDSCSDRFPAPAPMIRMHILLDTRDVTDEIMNAQDNYHAYYTQMREGVRFTTSQPSPQEYVEQFTPTLQAGQDILYLGFSSALSSAVQSANLAAEELALQFPDRKIVVVDTLCESGGLGLLVDYVLEKQASGASLQETADYAMQLRDRINHIFTVSDLKYLRRSGRLTATQAAFGTILDIKPILKCDLQGRLVPLAKCKGIKRAIAYMAESPVKRGAVDIQRMVLCHADDEALAIKVRDAILAKLPDAVVRLDNIGPVIGSHSGPGTIALFFLGDPKDRDLQE